MIDLLLQFRRTISSSSLLASHGLPLILGVVAVWFRRLYFSLKSFFYNNFNPCTTGNSFFALVSSPRDAGELCWVDWLPWLSRIRPFPSPGCAGLSGSIRGNHRSREPAWPYSPPSGRCLRSGWVPGRSDCYSFESSVEPSDRSSSLKLPPRSGASNVIAQLISFIKQPFFIRL